MPHQEDIRDLRRLMGHYQDLIVAVSHAITVASMEPAPAVVRESVRQAKGCIPGVDTARQVEELLDRLAE